MSVIRARECLAVDRVETVAALRERTRPWHTRANRQANHCVALHLVEGPTRLRLHQARHYVSVEALVG